MVIFKMCTQSVNLRNKVMFSDKIK